MTDQQNDTQRRLDEFQNTLQQLQADALEKHQAMMAPADAGEFLNDLANALTRRHQQMREALQRAEAHRHNGNDATRRAALEQAQQQWDWFTWITENQSEPPDDERQRCPACQLSHPDHVNGACASCYDNRIMYNTIG